VPENTGGGTDMTPHRLYVGTIGEGLFRSLDTGHSFRRACEGTFVECDVRALAVDPRKPTVLYMGTELGLFRSVDGADNWTRVEGPLAGLQVWSIHVPRDRPDVILVGTRPSALFRSDDGGDTWALAGATLESACPRILHTRVTAIVTDPDNADLAWAGVEIDGVHASRDGGRTWAPIGAGLSSRDIHALAVVPGPTGGRRLLAATNNDLNASDDDGATWKPLKIGGVLPWSYCRALAQPCGRPEVVLLGAGDGPPGSVGAVARSANAGETWTVAAMPGLANSTIWAFAVHPADPALIYAASVSGEIYRSTDAGMIWEKLDREFGEIRALAWAP
jgi:photosystem II stability/assembly factor-like uncharacterized protein